MQFFKKICVYSKVHKSEVKKSKDGKIITVRWIDTDKGQGVYRSRMVGREIKKRQETRLILTNTTPRDHEAPRGTVRQSSRINKTNDNLSI